MLVQSFFAGARFPNNSEKSFCNSSFTGEVSTSVNLERWEDADVRLLITTQANNKHLFGGKVTKEDMFEKIAEQFTKPSGCFVKRQRGACKQMGLVANGTRSSQMKSLNINFLKFFVNGKRPSHLEVSITSQIHRRSTISLTLA